MQHAQEKTDPAALERTRIIAAFRRLFSTEDGQTVLSHLRRSTDTLPGSSRPAFLPAADGKYCPLSAAIRDGRRSILLEIEAILAIPEDAEPPKPARAIKPSARGTKR
jgi:hypothetical protein